MRVKTDQGLMVCSSCDQAMRDRSDTISRPFRWSCSLQNAMRHCVCAAAYAPHRGLLSRHTIDKRVAHQGDVHRTVLDCHLDRASFERMLDIGPSFWDFVYRILNATRVRFASNIYLSNAICFFRRPYWGKTSCRTGGNVVRARVCVAVVRSYIFPYNSTNRIYATLSWDGMNRHICRNALLAFPSSKTYRLAGHAAT